MHARPFTHARPLTRTRTCTPCAATHPPTSTLWGSAPSSSSNSACSQVRAHTQSVGGHAHEWGEGTHASGGRAPSTFATAPAAEWGRTHTSGGGHTHEWGEGTHAGGGFRVLGFRVTLNPKPTWGRAHARVGQVACTSGGRARGEADARGERAQTTSALTPSALTTHLRLVKVLQVVVRQRGLQQQRV